MSVVGAADDGDDRLKRTAADTKRREVVENRFIMIDMGILKEV